MRFRKLQLHPARRIGKESLLLLHVGLGMIEVGFTGQEAQTDVEVKMRVIRSGVTRCQEEEGAWHGELAAPIALLDLPAEGGHDVEAGALVHKVGVERGRQVDKEDEQEEAALPRRRNLVENVAAEMQSEGKKGEEKTEFFVSAEAEKEK